MGPLVMPAIGAGLGLLTGTLPNLIEANRLRKERKRLLAEGAPGLSDIEKRQIELAEKRAQQPLTPEEQQQYAASQARAASALAPGYSQQMENIAQQQADVLAAGKRGSATSSNLLNLLGRMNVQGQAARRDLAIRGEQAQRAAQGELGRQTSYIGQARRSAQENLQNLSMLADARREQRKQQWERQLAAMDAARRQMIVKGWEAPITGAIGMTDAETFNELKKMGGGAKKETTPTAADVRFNPDTDMTDTYINQYQRPLEPTAEMTGLGPTYNAYEDPSIRSGMYSSPVRVNPYYPF